MKKLLAALRVTAWKTAIVLLVVFCLFSISRAWTTLGMGGGGAQYAPSISPLNPNLRFIGCDMSGWYRSTDGGNTWNNLDFFQISTHVDYDYNNGVMCDMAFHPTNASTIYGYGFQQDTQDNPANLLVSNDGGVTWSVLGSNSPWTGNGAGGRVTQIYIDRGNPNLILIGSDNGIYISTNGGASFKATTGSSGYINGIMIDQSSPVASRVCYAGAGEINYDWYATVPTGVFKSFDGGNTWAPANNGLPTTQVPSSSALYPAYGPMTASFAGTSTASGARMWVVDAVTNNIYTSTDASLWTLTSASTSSDAGTFLQIASADNDTSTVYCTNSNNRDIWKSTDGGGTWAMVFNDNSNPVTNATLGWIDYDLSFSGWCSPVDSISVNSADSSQVMFSDLGENVTSNNGGGQWNETYSNYADTLPMAQSQKWSSRGLEVTSVFQYAIDPNNSNYNYICASDIGFCYSSDAGQTWHNTARRIDGTVTSRWTETFYQVEFNPTAGTIFAAVSSLHDLDHSSPLGSWGEGGVLKSTNYGATWTNASTGLPVANPNSSPAITSLATSIVYDSAGTGTYYVAMWAQGVYKSTNNCASWTACAPVAIGTNKNVYSLKLAGGNLYCLLSGDGKGFNNPGGLFVSSDHGASWNNIATSVTGGLPLYYPTDFDVNPANNNIIFIAAQDFWSSSFSYSQELQGGCYRTTNGGTAWTQMNIPVPPVGSAPQGNTPYGYAPSIDPGNTNTVYYSTENQGFFQSLDNGNTWARVTDLPFGSIQHINFGAGNIYVGTFGCGVWQKAFGTATSTPVVSPTPTKTSTPIISPTQTRTDTASVTNSPTFTYTMTITQTNTPTQTDTPVPPGSTMTITPTLSATCTMLSATPTETNTPTPVPAITSSPTSEPAGPLKIGPIRLYPNPINPDATDNLNITLSLTGAVPDKITVYIYTAGFRLVRHKVFGSADFAGGILAYNCNDLKGLAAGTYYYNVIAEKAGEKSTSAADVLVILR